MVGNEEDKFHREVENGKFEFLDSLNDRPAIKRKYIKMYSLVSKCRRGFSTKNATQTQLEETAKNCELITKIFPVLSPLQSITRKMLVLSFVAPKEILKFKCVYKMLKIEQMGENMHCKLNKLEDNLKHISNKSKRYFYMLKAVEN